MSGRDTHPPLDLQAHFSWPWWWQWWSWVLHQWFISPCQVLAQSQNICLTQKLSAQPPMTALHDIPLCYEWGFCGTHTTFPCLSSSSHSYSLLVASKGYLGSFHLSSVLYSTIWRCPCPTLDSQIQILNFVYIYARSWQHISMLHQARMCPRTPFIFGYICAGNHSTWAPDVTQSPWYSALCIGYERYSWTPTLHGPFLVLVWSILCTFIHSS